MVMVKSMMKSTVASTLYPHHWRVTVSESLADNIEEFAARETMMASFIQTNLVIKCEEETIHIL